MRRRFSLALVLALALCLPAGAFAEGTLDYYYENYCGSCNIPQEFALRFYELTGCDASEYACAYHNVAYSAGRAAWDAAAEELGLSASERRLPMLVLDGEVYLGNDEISSALPARFSRETASDGTSRAYLLTITPCEDCAKAKALVEGLPGQIVLSGGESGVEIVYVDLNRDTDRALALFERYGVAERDRVAPSAFVGDTALCGWARIEAELLPRLLAGEGLSTPLFEAEAASGAGAELSVLSALGAGLVGGLNPCALSMLLMFLALLMPVNRRPGLCAGLFLAGKFVVYVLIGIGLSGLLRALAVDWLPLALKIALTVYCAALTLLNLSDALAARRGDYGALRNQLPARLRASLQGAIRRFAERPGRLALASLGLGAVIACGEFLCAGQVYLAVLMRAFGRDAAGVLAPMLTYCAAFLAPSAAAAVAVLRLKGRARLGNLLYERAAVIKAVTAAFFAVVLALTWI